MKPEGLLPHSQVSAPVPILSHDSKNNNNSDDDDDNNNKNNKKII